MSGVVLVVGEGVLADFVCKELSTLCRMVRQADLNAGVPEATELALLLHDAWHPSVHREAEMLLQPSGIPWLRGFVSFGEGVVGPLIRPGTPGCSQCADLRHLMAGRDRKEMWELQQRLGENGGISRDAWASHSGLLQVAQVLTAEVQRVLKGEQAHLESRVFLINLKTLKSSRHFFLPDPSCEVCGQMPDDSSLAARIVLQPNPKPSADSYRSRPLDDLKEVLSKEYLDYRTGFLNGKLRDLVSPFADVSVNLPLFTADESTSGRTHSYLHSEMTAILEGLERYCGLAPRGKRTVIHDSYHNLADHALDPVKVGLHAKEQYEKSGFPFKRFDPEQRIPWVWGYSFLQGRPILVPELLAYYSMGGREGFVFETSNGCALGGSLEEAIMYGILEVVERDSFLMTWYAELSLPRLDPHSADDKELRLMLERLQAVAGYEVHMFNATMENGIPSVWTLAKNRKQKGLNLICAGGAHPDPVRAVKSSIHELAAMLLTLDEKFEANRENYVRMLHDPYQVQKMEHHSMLYALPEAEERLQFLLDDSRPLRTFEEEFAQKPRHADLTDDLKDMLQTFQRLNLDVIVVDQTTPEISRNGLYCVKVLIPGMLPMTFGHHLTRLSGLDRVLHVPVELGYAKQPLTFEQLNPHPHPFP
ncbi:SagD family biosynthesis docking scaffold protein [Brevibacillus panacihumi W25]|uniref:SagD family biosynthesis docking scaffold protein n=1 Tax=Brevibacillus panacihumi W25 TaxID=1408254 RepID=V6MCE6_9BACL|nr:TOMM precursor leader peptide-binding protein [Brevibacillus panacihumi]EST55560.1 SagD family biosynthesis docking scaffold protein [Brevibacillus panacihumi W25]